MSVNAAPRSSISAGLLNPLQIVRKLWRQRELTWQLTCREISLRYRGAYLGTIWSLVNPLLMLVIYTFVFSTIFHSRWDGQPPGKAGETYFALELYAGLLPFTVFADVIGRAPTIVLSVPNYVKKVVFPLEVLPMVALGTALFQSFVSVAILLAGVAVFQRSVSSALWLLPLAYLPLILLSVGLGWFLTSLGTYIRDLAQGVVPVIQILTFLTPIFYPIGIVPISVRPMLLANPLTIIVQGFREALLPGQEHVLGTVPWLTWTAMSALLAGVGYVFFMKTKRGFADVL
ncbi:MAG TPA: ABC transporter permease [Tepidisphaeraceae bacterium]|jgi:lipopolysaccharide transport system permease protein|nr:ABC transporter permease [Tepidisphaeraceae bacterium]